MSDNTTQAVAAVSPLVIGSCIAYDFARAALVKPHTYSYIWRVSTPSLMTPPPDSGPTFSIDPFSDDERRIFCHDYFKTFDFNRKIKNCDSVFIDFFRDSYDFIRAENNSFVTRGPEYWSHNLLDQVSGDLVRAGTREHSEIWLKYADDFCSKYNDSRAPQTYILNCPAVAWQHESSRCIDLDSFDILEVRRKNYLISAMCQYMHSNMNQSILVDYDVWRSAANLEHDWGAGPVHLTSESVRVATQRLPTAIVRSRLMHSNSEIAKETRSAISLAARRQLSQIEDFR